MLYMRTSANRVTDPERITAIISSIHRSVSALILMWGPPFPVSWQIPDYFDLIIKDTLIKSCGEYSHREVIVRK